MYSRWFLVFVFFNFSHGSTPRRLCSQIVKSPALLGVPYNFDTHSLAFESSIITKYSTMYF